MAPVAIRFARTAVLMLLSALYGNTVLAADQRYDYDPLGRLVRSVQEGQSSEYLYDPAGNLLQVTGGAAQPPVIDTGDLGDFRLNEYRQAALSGSNLNGATLRTDHPGIHIDNVAVSAGAISFRVAVEKLTPLGAHQLYVDSAAGSTAVGMNVVPGYVITYEPQPIVVPPDNQARKYTLRLPEPPRETLTFNLGTASGAIAKTKTATVSIPAGQTTADIGVIGVAIGNTTLRLGGANLLEPMEALVSVASDGGNQLVYSQPLGITRSVPWALPAASQTYSMGVGVVRHVPWAFPANSIINALSVGIVYGVPWTSSTGAVTFSPGRPVGIVRVVPFALPEGNMTVSSPLGISKP